MKEASVHLWYSWKWPWNNEIHRVNVWVSQPSYDQLIFFFLYIIVIICERYKIDVVHSFRTFLIKITNKSREYVWIGFWNNDSSNLSHVLARTQEKQIYKVVGHKRCNLHKCVIVRDWRCFLLQKKEKVC